MARRNRRERQAGPAAAGKDDVGQTIPGRGRLGPSSPRGAQMDSASLITTPFDASSTADDVVEGMDLHGRQPVDMGASSGLGVETARAANSSHRVQHDGF